MEWNNVTLFPPWWFFTGKCSWMKVELPPFSLSFFFFFLLRPSWLSSLRRKRQRSLSRWKASGRKRASWTLRWPSGTTTAMISSCWPSRCAWSWWRWPTLRGQYTHSWQNPTWHTTLKSTTFVSLFHHESVEWRIKQLIGDCAQKWALSYVQFRVREQTGEPRPRVSPPRHFSFHARVHSQHATHSPLPCISLWSVGRCAALNHHLSCIRGVAGRAVFQEAAPQEFLHSWLFF